MDQSSNTNDYEAPAVEAVLAAEDVDREVQYAGVQFSGRIPS